MDKEKRKQLVQNYRERSIEGAVFGICNKTDGRVLLLTQVDLHGGLYSRARSAIENGGPCPVGNCPALTTDWNTFGNNGFAFIEYERLLKRPDIPDADFKNEITLSEKLWREELAGTLYR